MNNNLHTIKKYLAIKCKDEGYEYCWFYLPTSFFLEHGCLDDGFEYDNEHLLPKHAEMFDGAQESCIEYLGDNNDMGRSLLEDASNSVLVFDDFETAVTWRKEKIAVFKAVMNESKDFPDLLNAEIANFLTENSATLSVEYVVEHQEWNVIIVDGNGERLHGGNGKTIFVALGHLV